ncbi:hypothetical protein LAZ67_5001500 [Cordylochernes scorpioides]|uniref:Transposase n=1 Tax=Cordylochernes scorpioides TaxID=51811 RepID=A0ABY6KJ77_9ARAC|nr:hypothetical protein LAZ67_5001500 [Cordylochernes scorpioides]
MLTVAYGEATLGRKNVYRWNKMFSEGREDVNDEERAGRPSTSTTDEKINEVEKMILANRRITHRMNIANEMLDSVRYDPNLLQRVITGDEAWVYGYDVETKAQSSQWKLPHEPRPKKARQVRWNVKVLLTVFFDCRGVVHHEFLPQGRTVNKEYYLQVMRNLCKAICQKRPDLWKNKNWLLHHDNAPAHTSLLPPYSPDLAPCDFFLFPKLKRPMKGRRYATLDEIKTASKEELKKILKNDFLKCFEDWKNRWHKCIISHGDYFEGGQNRDRIVLGIKDNRVRKKLLMEPKLNLSSAIDICRTAEVTEQQITKLTGQESEDVKWNRKYERKKEATKATNETFTVGRIIGRLHVLRMPSNGKAESAVKYAKMLVKKAKHEQEDLWVAILEWRNTPLKDLGFSPNQALISRRTQTLIPIHKNLVKPEVQLNVYEKIEKRKTEMKNLYDKQARDLTKLNPGQSISVKLKEKDKWRMGKCISAQDPRSYIVEATPSTINAVENLILEDRKISIFTIADNLNISYGTVHTIFNEQLQFRKICCRWIPHFLNLDQKLNRIRVSKALLKQYEEEGDHFLDQIVTGDESWCYHYDPLTKCTSMDWKRGDSPRPKKIRSQHSAGKNTHPAYSPDLAPSDYFLFGLLKKELKGKRFDSDEDVQKVVQDFFHTLPKSAYKEGIYKFPERWRRCIESQAEEDLKQEILKEQVKMSHQSSNVIFFTEAIEGIPEIDGTAVPIIKWIQEIDDNTILVGWTGLHTLVVAKKLLTGVAKLRSQPTFSTWPDLKEAITHEFNNLMCYADFDFIIGVDVTTRL